MRQDRSLSSWPWNCRCRTIPMSRPRETMRCDAMRCPGIVPPMRCDAMTVGAVTSPVRCGAIRWSSQPMRADEGGSQRRSDALRCRCHADAMRCDEMPMPMRCDVPMPMRADADACRCVSNLSSSSPLFGYVRIHLRHALCLGGWTGGDQGGHLSHTECPQRGQWIYTRVCPHTYTRTL